MGAARGVFLWCFVFVGAWGLPACSDPPPPLPTASENDVAFPEVSGEAAPRGPLLLRDVTLVDGRGGSVRRGVDILVSDGRIEAIGEGLEHPEAHELPVRGQTVLPGLIDGHVHLASAPGALLRGDSKEMETLQQRLQLRAYLASGVTSVLDAAIPASTLRELRAWAEAGNPSPTIHALNPYFTPSEGYFSSPDMRAGTFADLWAPVEGTAALDEAFRAAQSLAPAGVKVTVERGMVFDVYRLFTDQELKGIREAAARFETPIFVHSMTNEAHRRALMLEPWALVHVGMIAETMEDDVASAIAESGAFVVSTLATYHMESWTWQPELLDEPWIRMRVPRVQWATAHHPAALERVFDISTPFVKPRWLPNWIARMGASWFRSKDDGMKEAVASGRAAKKLADRGVPIVMGSDAGNWPVFVTLFHGVGSLLEMQLLEQAGLSRQEVIVSATSRAAKMLRVDDEVGTVEVGKVADLIVVPSNPLEAGMAALTDLSWVLKAGEARTPGGWLGASRLGAP
jgi:imidazolonepropionase-like amidohydrolase